MAVAPEQNLINFLGFCDALLQMDIESTKVRSSSMLSG